jgi:hypothetical protein
MKTSAAIIAGALILLVSVAAFFLYNDSVPKLNSDTPSPNPTKSQTTNTLVPTSKPTSDEVVKAKITNFTSSGWFCPVGVVMDIVFDVTIQNNGSQNITGLNLLIKRTLLVNDDHSILKTFDVPAGEKVSVSYDIGTDIDQYTHEFRGSTYTASISLNGVVLDEKTIEIVGSQF